MGTAIRRLTWIFVTCLAPLAGCGFDGDAARLGLDDEASSSTESPITASCTATGHVAEINTIWSVIQSNCGGITGCGTRDVRDTHVDVFIPHANYCACYAMLFANRTRAPFNGVQIIYHEKGACTGSGAHRKSPSTMLQSAARIASMMNRPPGRIATSAVATARCSRTRR